MASNPLSASALLQGMADALPTKSSSDTTSSLSGSHESLALFAHACMVSLGFKLLGFDEKKTEEAKCRDLAPRLPENWNASFNTYAFVYAHGESTHRYVITIDRMGGTADIRGVTVGEEDRIARFQVTTKDYIANTAMPVRIARQSDGDDQVEDRTELPQKLREVFISDRKMSALANLFKINIVENLFPSLPKQTYEETLDEDDRVAREDLDDFARQPPRQPMMPDPMPQPAQPYPFDDPLRPAPRNPVPAGEFPPPGFEDPYDLNRPRREPFPAGGPPFGGLGADDLNPPGLGPNDPLRPHLGGRGSLPRPGGPSGMHPTFDDPMFGGGFGQPDFDPQIPPGARYDPIGPGGVPRLGGRRPGGGGSNPFGGGGGFGGGFGGGGII
jgi:hypothetical protein